MNQAIPIDSIQVRASDVTGQRSERVSAPPQMTVGEWVESLVGRLGLKRTDANGAPYAYRPRLAREGRQLNAGEIVGEVLREDDHVVLQPNVHAG